MLFRLEEVAKEFGSDWLFRGATVQFNVTDRIGLIGRNGCGKTTLLDLVEGRFPPDEGRIVRASGLSLSRIAQIPDFDPDTTVREEALRVFQGMRSQEQRLRELETEMAASADSVHEGLAAEYEALSLKFRLQGGYDYEARTEAVLHGVGFAPASITMPCGQLSGGQQSRLLLAQALLRAADLLLLDEPTNHLDIQGILWLTEYLQGESKPFVVISHDRHFLDRVTNRTWEIEARKLFDYAGSFSRAREMRQVRLESEEREYRKQQEWKAKTEDYIRRNIAGQKTKQAQSRRKSLSRTEWLERPGENRESLRLKIPEVSRAGSLIFKIEQGSVGYPGAALIQNVNLEIRRGERIGIVGGNGSGKTTLLRTLVGELPLLSGELDWGHNISIAYYSQNPSLGAEDRTVYDCLRDLDRHCSDQDLRDFAARFLFRDEDVFKQVYQLSGGERSRLALARLFFHPANVLLMDEPTNHLDIQSREALEAALNDYEGTLIIVSHDLYFLRRVVELFSVIREFRFLPEEDLDHVVSEFQVKSNGKKSQNKKDETAPAAKPAGSLSKNERLRRERRLKELEGRISGLETRRGEIQQALQEEYEDFDKLHELSEEHGSIEEELASLYREWEDQASELADA
jgi:ATP-binding cassette, subfamily F, member 3